jgi:hypothetical protein
MAYQRTGASVFDIVGMGSDRKYIHRVFSFFYIG